MSRRQLEAEILYELKETSGKRKLRQKDIMEWNTRPIEPRDGETVFWLPIVGVYVAVAGTL